jgi:hypothetical protein
MVITLDTVLKIPETRAMAHRSFEIRIVRRLVILFTPITETHTGLEVVQKAGKEVRHPADVKEAIETGKGNTMFDHREVVFPVSTGMSRPQTTIDAVLRPADATIEIETSETETGTEIRFEATNHTLLLDTSIHTLEEAPAAIQEGLV